MKQRIFRFVALMLVLTLLCLTVIPAGAQTLYWGSRGETVIMVQKLLMNWGYYSGSVDGVFGQKTYDAVVHFQKKNGLKVDGVVGAATFRALGLSSGSSGGSGGYSDSDYRLLANIISAEARGESYTGQVAVGAVVLNRVKHPSFPNTIAGVVYQSGAFTAVTDGQISKPVSASAYNAARDALNGWDPSGGAIYYYNPAKTSNRWIRSRPVITTIGSHVFCS
ncbi:MAG: spore cortex-lytic enzyme [Clostridia bacterium]|nr:spore cortex-lytic enzyme [Clostridia bacterium]